MKNGGLLVRDHYQNLRETEIPEDELISTLLTRTELQRFVKRVMRRQDT